MKFKFVSQFERIIILISIICLSLYGISALNGETTTAATAEFNKLEPKSEISEGYISRNVDVNYASEKIVYSAEVNYINK